MDQASAQTEKIATYETSRTRRSIVDGNIHSDDSNNDEEYATSGFYVREKTTEKRPASSNSTSKDSDKECKENGVLPVKEASSSPKENGENSRDEESSRDSKNQDSPDKGDENLDKATENEEESLSKKESEPEEKDPVEEKEESNNENDDTEDKPDGSVEKSEDCDKNEEKSSDSSEETKEEPKEDASDDVEKDAKASEKSNAEEDQKETENKNESDDKIDEVKDTTAVSDEEKKSDKKDDKTETNNDKEDSNVSSVAEDKSNETSKDSKEPASKDDKGDDVKMKDESGEKKLGASILKDHLEKSANSEENENEMEMDEDFDPSLLCPDISMDVDEAPVITNEQAPDDGSTSPLPYEATFSTLVDEITGAEVQVDLTPEEMELRTKMYGPTNLVQYTKVHCTACNVHLGSALTGANNRFVHPLLKVLICKNCYHFYTSGEFEKDEDGSELYCRWCGQGGQVLCCSSCEFVFCKRCIRNNFGPKKFKEIRDRDDWNCFRCDRGQLSNLRASCAEFMEYYRTELARAQALSQTNPELMTTDYTTCCKNAPEKKNEAKTPAPQRSARKKKMEEEDPDYHPVIDDDEPPKKKFVASTPSSGPGYTVIPPGGLRPVVPKPASGQTVRPVITQQGQRPQNQGQVFKVGNTTFRAKTPVSGQGYTVQKPTVTGKKDGSPGYITIPPSAGKKDNSPGYITIPPSAGKKDNSPGYTTIPPASGSKSSSPGYITIPPSSAPKTTTPGYIKILPQRMQGPRPSSQYTVVSGTSNGKPTFTTVRPKQAAPMPSMKHEWFEKTVRAAARVNSNLSYTLTQLNRQQSQANSVEALAMVHNKLQEVLSTSINSLIQIRKNLRTEFISGIKNIKFPPKPAPIPVTSGPIVVKDDDDVIFVNPTKTPNPLPPPPPLVLSPSVTLTKKTPIQKTSDPFADPKPSTSGVSSKTNSSNNPPPSSGPVKGGFLKVRSFTALQSVPSECITIPDDPPVTSNGKTEEEDPLKLDDPLQIPDDDKPKEDKAEVSKSPVPEPEPEVPAVFNEHMVYNVKEEPSPAVKKMLNAVVMVKKSRVVDEIIRAQGLLKVNDKKEKDESNKKEKEEKSENNEEKEKEKTSDTNKEEVEEEGKTVEEDSAKSEKKS